MGTMAITLIQTLRRTTSRRMKTMTRQAMMLSIVPLRRVLFAM